MSKLNYLLSFCIRFDKAYIYPHRPEEQCSCRKPLKRFFSFWNDSRVIWFTK